MSRLSFVTISSSTVNYLKGNNAICAGTRTGSDRTFVLDTQQPGRKREVKQKIVDMALNGSGVRDTARVLQGKSSNSN